MIQRKFATACSTSLLLCGALLVACAPPPVAVPGVLRAPARFSLLMVGDTGQAPSWRRKNSGQRAVGRSLALEDERAPVDALVFLGDNFYPHGLRADALVPRIRANIVGPYCNFVALDGPRAPEVASACPASSDASRGPPLYAVLGNHDYNTPGSPELQRHAIPLFVSNWRVPDGVAEVVEFPAGVSLVLVDSERLRRDGAYEWVERALRRSEGPWRILAAHHPLDVSPGAAPDDRAYSEALLAAVRDSGVALHVLAAGHEHHLEVRPFPPPGPQLHVIAGSGSSVRKPTERSADAHVARGALGFARIDLQGTGSRQRLLVSVFESVSHWNGRAEPSHVASFEVRDANRSSARSAADPDPPQGDLRAQTLREYQRAWLAARGDDARNVSLRAKAEFFSWQIANYHTTQEGWVSPRVWLPRSNDESVQFDCGADQATWNGALLAALAYEYATEKSPRVLERIATQLDGLRFFVKATGESGLAARCVVRSDEPFLRAVHPYRDENGVLYHYRGDSAKGTYNQMVLGYATLLVVAGDDLPPPLRERARTDLNALVLHLIEHDFRVTERGKPTRYGNLTPVLPGNLGVPFNAQVAYAMLSAAKAFPPASPASQADRERIETHFADLRGKRIYYEDPLRHWLIRPQRAGTSVFMSDMNDRNHLVNAAFLGLLLEIHRLGNGEAEADPAFFYELGRTLYWSMSVLEGEKNSLVNFMWSTLLRDPVLSSWLLPEERDRLRSKADRELLQGVEQLRRFTVDRLRPAGYEVRTEEPQWVDAYRPDSYQWKANPRLRWQVTGPPDNYLTSAIDYLHAYWLMRYFGLDAHPDLAHEHADVLP